MQISHAPRGGGRGEGAALRGASTIELLCQPHHQQHYRRRRQQLRGTEAGQHSSNLAVLGSIPSTARPGLLVGILKKEAMEGTEAC